MIVVIAYIYVVAPLVFQELSITLDDIISLSNAIFHINSGLNSMLAAPRKHTLLSRFVMIVW